MLVVIMVSLHHTQPSLAFCAARCILLLHDLFASSSIIEKCFYPRFKKDVVGCSFGYIVSKLLGMSPKETRTISLETGIQNFSIALAVVQLSFAAEEEAQKYALMFPACYGFLYLFWSVILVVFFKYYLAPKDYKGLDNDEKDSSSSQKVEFPIAVGDDEEERGGALKKEELETGNSTTDGGITEFCELDYIK